MTRVFFFAILFFVLTLVFHPSIAEVPSYYVRAASSHQVPPEVLYAVAMQESKLPAGQIQGISKPWPWTLNCEGKPYYLATKAIASSYASFLLGAGINCDIGLMQTNWKWQKHRFDSIDEALDPYTNISVGASILREWYEQHGSWAAAVGAYHSPSNKNRAARYTRQVKSHLLRILKREQL